MPRGTTATFLWFALLAAATALAPLEELRLVPTPAQLAARIRGIAPGGNLAVAVAEPGPPPSLPFVSPATADPPTAGHQERALAPDPLVAAEGSAADDPRLARDVARAYALGARELPVEEPCLEPPGPALAGCTRGALDAFHEALGRARSGGGFARIVHFGDSTISSDLIAGTVRERLQARFGDGGRGFLFVDGPTRYHGQLRRAGRASPGWEIRSLAGPFADDGRYGMAGASFQAQKAGEQVTFAARGNEVFDLHYLGQPGGAGLSVLADGAQVGEVQTTSAEKAVQFSRFRLPSGTKQVTVRARGPATVHGAVLERDGAGLVYDTLGVPGSSSTQVLAMDEGDLTAALRRRRPDLLVVMLGMNESHALRDDAGSLSGFEARERRMLAKLRRAAPFASCLVTSPMDGARKLTSGEIQSKPILRKIRDAQRRSALEAGCAFWDMYESMGGSGSMGSWVKAGLAFPDLSHPSNDGGPVLGFLLSDALLGSHRSFLARAPSGGTEQEALLGSPPGLADGFALGGFFDALARLQAREPGAQVRVLQLGDSHTAADKLPSQLRRRFAGAFGAAGRGLVFPGEPFRTPSPDDVERSGDGFVTDEGLTATLPATFGAGGLVARAADPAAHLSIAPCEGCPFSDTGAFEVHYLPTPGGGGLDLLVDGRKVRTVATAKGPEQSPLGIARLELPAGRHELTLRPAGDGEVRVTGVELLSGKSGVSWSGAGLSGALAGTPLAWELPAFHAEIAHERPALVVLAYGTNEAREGAFDPEIYRALFRRLTQRVRSAAREASCLVVGPPDTWISAPGGRVPSPHLTWIVGVQREVAAKEGCAFWDARAAMGGEGAMGRWVAAGLGHKDAIHFSPAGYRRLGDLLFDDLIAAFGERATRQESARAPPP